MSVVAVRCPVPLPVPVVLGVDVRVTLATGQEVTGRVVGVYRAPADDGHPDGVYVQLTPRRGWPGLPDRFPPPDYPWVGP